MDAPLPHSTEPGARKFPHVAPPPVGRVGCYVRDTPHRDRFPIHEDL